MRFSLISTKRNLAIATTDIKYAIFFSVYENGLNGQHVDLQDGPPLKRTPQNTFLFSHQSLLVPNISSAIPNSHFLEYNQHNHPAQRVLEDNNNQTSRGDEEWRNIHVMLNCILSMVEKTKRALTILQQRNSQDLTNEWLRKQDVGVDLKKAANEIMLQAVRQTEDRVAEVRRRAEDAVNDVKRQAVIELQKAVAAAETKANELVNAERAKMEKVLAGKSWHFQFSKPQHDFLIDVRKHPEDSPETAESSLSPHASSQTVLSQQNVRFFDNTYLLLYWTTTYGLARRLIMGCTGGADFFRLTAIASFHVRLRV